MDNQRLLRASVDDLRSSWKPLALTDIAFKIVAFIVLTPLVGILFRVLLAASGNAVLSDVDILLFFLGPVGWLCFILIGALWLGILALEQAALVGIIAARASGGRLTLLGALRFAAAHAWPVVQVTGRIVAFTLLSVAPFLAVAAAVYFTLLTEHDINFYLKEKPPVFLVALGIGGVLVVAMAAVLLRLFTGWAFALPLVLFENESPSTALRRSRERVDGHRRTVLLWLVGWGLMMTGLSALATGFVALCGRLVVPDATSSLHLLAVAIGATLLLGSLANLVVNLLSTTTFAVILLNIYRHFGGGEAALASQQATTDRVADAIGFRLTRGRLLAAGIVGVLVAAGVGVVAMRSVRLEDKVAVMAHRGSSKAAPENTMAAFKQAIEDGADWVEIDVQETADGEVVVFHDSDFMKVAGNDLKIWDATVDDLKDIDIGSWFSPDFSDQRVPTLADVLTECKGKIGVNIELKYYGHDEQLEQRVVDIVEAHGMASEVMLMSLKPDGIAKARAIRPDWKVGLLMSVAAGDLEKIDADFLAVNAAFVNRRFVGSAHDINKEVYVWTVNDAPTMSAMISRRVDGLLTDKPALARTVLEQRAQMSAPERLLLELAGVLGAEPEIGEP